MERAAVLTGPAGRPMIASGYEKAGRGWTNSLLPNGMRSFPHTRRLVLSRMFTLVQRIRLRWESDPAFAGVRLWLYARARAAGF
jgi:hypothetical protein